MAELEIPLKTLTPLWPGGIGGTCDRLHLPRPGSSVASAGGTRRSCGGWELASAIPPRAILPYVASSIRRPMSKPDMIASPTTKCCAKAARRSVLPATTMIAITKCTQLSEAERAILESFAAQSQEVFCDAQEFISLVSPRKQGAEADRNV